MSEISSIQPDGDYPMVEVWTDGACIPTNPGPGGWSAVMRQDGWRDEISGHESHTTNNRMELMGPIRALEWLPGSCSVTIHSDSRYVVDGMSKWILKWRKTGWKKNTVKNRDLWERLSSAAARHRVSWVWVKGHSGVPLNERADHLANSAAVSKRAYASRIRETG